MSTGYNLDYSATYKIRTPFSEKAFYFTIVGNPPHAFFLNSKKMKHFQYTSALLKSYARQVKKGCSVEDVIKDMKTTFDPSGSYIIPDGSGMEACSFVCHLGVVLERHLKILEELKNESS